MSVETQSFYRCVVSAGCIVTNTFRAQNLIHDCCCNVCNKTLFPGAVGDAEMKGTVVSVQVMKVEYGRSSPLFPYLDITWG